LARFAENQIKNGEKQMVNGVQNAVSASIMGRDFRGGASALAIGIMLTAALPSGAYAQSAAAAAQAAVGQDSLEEVVVTARRVEERQQTTPISVTSLSPTMLKALDINRIQGIDTIAPNILIDEGTASGFGAIIYIRGIGAISVTSYSDPPVSVYVDGVVQARPNGNAFDLPDVERVEVLRGPQGTLFGRNTTGGAISIFTKKPAQEFGGSVEFGYGNFNELNASVILNTGEIGNSGIYTKFVGQDHFYDGWVKTPGRDAADSYGYYRSKSASFSLSKAFSDNFTLDNRAFLENEADLPSFQLVTGNATFLNIANKSASRGGPPVVIGSGPLDLEYLDPRQALGGDPNASDWGDTLNLAYELGDYLTLKSITGYRALTPRQTGQLGGSYFVGPVGTLTNIVPVNQINSFNNIQQDQESEELQATGKYGGFNYVFGVYYFHEQVGEMQISQTPTFLASGLTTIAPAVLSYNLDSSSYAAYGNVGYKPEKFDDKLEVSGGLRYTYDAKSENTTRLLNGTSQGRQIASQNWDNIGWSASLNYQWTDDLMTYIRGSSAYRSGGFNPTTIGAPAFDPETAITMEAGFKSEWFERRFRLNVAGFKTFYDNVQINQRDAQKALSIIVNAGAATYTGFEVEGEAILGYGFQLNGSLGYVDPEYQSYLFKDASGNPVNIANLARFPLVSKWTYNIGGQYKSPETPVGVFTGVINYAYQSSHYFQPVDSLAPNNAANPSGPSENLRASLTLSEIPIATGSLKNVRIQAYVDNLLDYRFKLLFVDFSSYGAASFNRPRSYGVRFTADY
jgi:iron complex outermembrane receptor protein